MGRWSAFKLAVGVAWIMARTAYVNVRNVKMQPGLTANFRLEHSFSIEAS